VGRCKLSDLNISWDLTEIFPGTNDLLIQEATNKASEGAKAFQERYRNKIQNLSPQNLLKCLQEFEDCIVKLQDISLYASLAFAANMTLLETQKLYDNISKLESGIGKTLAFFDLELGMLIKQKPQTIKDPTLTDYKHVLERIQRRVQHQLSETEEQLIIEKDQFGIKAWEDLQSKWLNTRMFEITVNGEKKLLSYGDANGLLSNPDRATRESANKSIYGALGRDGEIFSSALRSICNDWMQNCTRRKYPSPMEGSLISNDTKQPIITNLLDEIERNVPLYRRYLKLKANLMNLPKLGCHDIIAPLPSVSKLKFTYEQATDLVTRAYSRFDPEYALPVKDMFKRKHIDASTRFGKRNGAFCASWYTGKSAYILTSFNGSLSDVYTLAHELGHATHDYYSQKNQTPLNLSIPSTVAETASIFGELLLTDLLINEAKPKEKKAILCQVLDEAGMTTFQVTARVWFEQSLYQTIQQNEFLEYKTICQHWTTARNRIYGDAVEWFNEMDAEWTMKPHYYMANYRFYNYPYVYAQMFVYTLYQKYLEEGQSFIPKLKTVLSAGSSISPTDIGKILGMDVTESTFWKTGFKTFEGFLSELEEATK
jgi:oligoendopeptidase F